MPRDEARTLADKLNTLFDTVHPAGRGPYSNAEVAAGVAELGGSISPTYVWMLRNGKKTNPTIEHLQALADFFGVSPAYFFDDSKAAEIERDLRSLQAMRSVTVRAMAARLGDLSEDQLQSVAPILDSIIRALQVHRSPSRRRPPEPEP